ncbi:hypothetical protein Pam4_18 [Pseudanabaena phage Pam4]|nr:hypothetical protein Pam4_18 [Pseudanabaena phage Pam4]
MTAPKPPVLTPLVGVEYAEAFTRLSATLTAAGEVWARASRQAAAALSRMGEALTGAANDPVRVAGVEARAYVHGGMACADQAALGAYVREVLAGEADGCAFLTAANRARVAAEAARGYVTHHIEPAPTDGVLAWHRLVGDRHLQVVRHHG